VKLLYADSSVLVRKYVQEAGSAHLLGLLAGVDGVAVSAVAYAEIMAAFQRKHREKGISGPQLQRARDEFREDWSTLAHVPVTEALHALLDELLAQSSLRGFDAIHLASALLLHRRFAASADGVLSFAAADRRLLDAAAKAGLRVEPFPPA
jgi:predicted nucleic acid-binding protein